MPPFKVVAHRGLQTVAPENTMAAFRGAVDIGADAAELDVRLTRDGRPVVYHNYYLDEVTSASGPIFERTLKDLESVDVIGTDRRQGGHRIPTLEAVLEEFGGRLHLEIEIKGPEPEAAAVVGSLLTGFRQLWDRIEVTSFEPSLLVEVRRSCPGMATALLCPRSEDWMGPDVVAYASVHRARLAQARAVHLHPTQLAPEVVSGVRAAGLDVHAWEVNDEATLQLAANAGLTWICTDEVERALAFRSRI